MKVFLSHSTKDKRFVQALEAENIQLVAAAHKRDKMS
jgi:hypothetical protein